MNMIRRPWARPIVTMHVAGRFIQRVYRGSMLRKRLQNKVRMKKKQVGKVNVEQHLSVWKHSKVKLVSTIRLQKFYRRNIVFLRYRKYRLYTIAATSIVVWIRSLKAEPENIAACAIQRVYRQFCDKKVFVYYRDLLNFQNSGDPKEMLRAINPNEAGLMDEASGTIVRFRLGGVSYPPDIYYKIFTKTSVCDVGAFAPRKYAGNQQPPADFLHNKMYDEHG